MRTSPSDRRAAGIFLAAVLLLLAVSGLRIALRSAGVVAGDEVRDVEGRLTTRAATNVAHLPLDVAPRRGTITDRAGRPLATEWCSLDLVADPRGLAQVERFRLARRFDDARYVLSEADLARYSRRLCRRLCDALELSGHPLDVSALETLREALARGFRVDAELRTDVVGRRIPLLKLPRWNPLVRGLSPAAARRMEDALATAGQGGLSFERRPRRDYPYGAAASQIVGRVAHEAGELRGSFGIEQRFDSWLRGVAGSDQAQRDRHGRRFRLAADGRVPGREGATVELTLDAELQRMTLEILVEALAGLEAEGASAVVLDARNGDVLAAVSAPSFEPHERLKGSSAMARTRPGPFAHQHEPGSTIKPIFYAWAREHGLLEWDEHLDCGGGDGIHLFGRRRVPEFSPNPDGLLAVEALERSSNVASVRIVRDRMGLEATVAALRAFGFADKPRIELADCEAPYFRLPEVSDARFERDFPRWNGPSWAMGYAMVASPLVMARAYTVFATDGQLLEPRLVRRVLGAEEAIGGPSTGARQVVSPRVASEMRSALERVVENGTGKALSGMRWRVGAKPGTPRLGHRPGAARSLYRPSICAIAPIDEPRVIVTLVVRRLQRRPGAPYGGGSVAGPIARRILQKGLEHLGVEPDRPAVGEQR